ncbi:MFS transporter [Cohnella herbarum]|uniref:MFS transporter n=1 Tax=Cohnella herbarum TaxID=2728023 RepID=A0A7Z2ZPV8_9BACL|nr:MFS transporter [Cohnella herbarum]QJD86377.1 MFS transporter [Cohnella herbarum]
MDSKHAPSPVTADRLMRLLALTLIVSVMNATMFNVALPRISLEFSLSPSKASWVITAYIVVYAIGTVTYGKLADRYSLRNLLTFGLPMLAFGSLIGLMAGAFWMLVLARVLQAMGASVVTAASMLIPVRYYPLAARGRALGMTATGIALGTAAGPIISGIVTSVASWRLLFLLPLLALIALPFFRRELDGAAGTKRPTDVWGGLLLGGSIAALLLALTNSSLMLLAAGLLLTALFGLRIRFAREPFIQLALLGNTRFSFALLITGLSSCAVFGIPFLVPLLLGNVNGLSPLHTGLAMLPAAVLSALLGRRGGTLADKYGIGVLFYTAALLFASGFVLLSWTAGSSPGLIACFLIFGSVGQTFTQIALSHTLSGTLTAEQTGVGMGLYSLVSFIAGAASTALIGRTLDFGASGRWLNPLHGGGAGLVYSNLFLALAALVSLTAILYAVFAAMSRRASRRAGAESPAG